MTHQRRSKGNPGATVTFTADMPVTMKKEQFLANRQNKQRFIYMLSEELQKRSCMTHHAPGDADLLIVPFVQLCWLGMTQIYLLVLLCHHACPESKDLFFCSEPKKNMKKHRIWD